MNARPGDRNEIQLNPEAIQQQKSVHFPIITFGSQTKFSLIYFPIRNPFSICNPLKNILMTTMRQIYIMSYQIYLTYFVRNFNSQYILIYSSDCISKLPHCQNLSQIVSFRMAQSSASFPPHDHVQCTNYILVYMSITNIRKQA